MPLRRPAPRSAQTTLVSGPTHLDDPRGVTTVRVETAAEMLAACDAALPADVAICAAAVADWRVAAHANQKIKKGVHSVPSLELVENPDILATLSKHKQRPELMIGFAAETEMVLEHGRSKRVKKGCDWILANDVSPETGVMGGDQNQVFLITEGKVEDWPRMPKAQVAAELALRIAAHFGGPLDAAN